MNRQWVDVPDSFAAGALAASSEDVVFSTGPLPLHAVERLLGVKKIVHKATSIKVVPVPESIRVSYVFETGPAKTLWYVVNSNKPSGRVSHHAFEVASDLEARAAVLKEIQTMLAGDVDSGAPSPTPQQGNECRD